VNIGIAVFRLSLLISLLTGGWRAYAAGDVGPALFNRDYGYLESGYWDRNDTSGLVLKACQQAQRSDCGKAISALRAFANAKSSDPKVLDDTLAIAFRDLKNATPDSPIYPALVFWISRITPVIVIDKARHDRLTRMGIVYQRNEIAGDWYLAVTPLEGLALKRPDTYWGRQAFLELIKNGWQAMPRCWASGVIPAVIHHGEEFLSKHPNADIFPAVVYAVAIAYEDWWSIVKNKVVQEREVPENVQEYEQGAERARTKAIYYYKQYLALVGSSPTTKAKIERLGRAESNEGLFAGAPYSCEGD
jgi:hypothetical protein